MRFIRTRGWFKEEPPERQFIVEEVEGDPVAVEGKLFFVSYDKSGTDKNGTCSVYDAKKGMFIFGGQKREVTMRILKTPGFRDRAWDSLHLLMQHSHRAAKAMMTRIREEYETRGQQDMELQKVWETANRQVVTESDAKSIECDYYQKD